MTDDPGKHLTKLRNVESTSQWNECRESVKFLFATATEIDIVRVLLRQIERFLSDAHNVYPNDENISDEISKLENVTSLKMLSESGQSIILTLEKRSNEPGINNFRNALTRLRKLDSIAMPAVNYSDALVDVLSGILMAILSQQWGRQNPDLWSKSFLQESREDAVILARYFWPNPRTIQLNKELWDEVADDIESSLLS